MVRERLAELIGKEPYLFVCGQADNIGDGFDVVQKSPAKVCIVDISLKGSSGLELIKNMKAADVPVPVLVVSMHEESVYAERALRAGATGYISKQAESDDIMTAIRKAIVHETYVAPRIASRILRKFAAGHDETDALSRLTDRELEVFELIGAGRTTREIGIQLGLSPATVETYRARIKQKLGLENANQLTTEAAHYQRRFAPNATAA